MGWKTVMIAFLEEEDNFLGVTFLHHVQFHEMVGSVLEKS